MILARGKVDFMIYSRYHGFELKFKQDKNPSQLVGYVDFDFESILNSIVQLQGIKLLLL